MTPPVGNLAARWGLTPTDDGGLRADIAPRWMLPDRVFGGYSAALCCAATVAAAAPYADLRLLSATIGFLAPVRPEPVAFEVETVRRGRRVSWIRGTGRQAGRSVVTSLLAVAPAPDGPAAAVADDEPPTDLPRLDFLAEIWPFTANFDERAADYPTSLEGFSDGGDLISLWLRALDPVFAGDPLAEQLADLTIVDAHLLDAVCRVTDTPLTDAFSVDLHVVWGSRPVTSAWRRVTIRGDRGDGFGICSADVLAADGSLRAWAVQQGVLGG